MRNQRQRGGGGSDLHRLGVGVWPREDDVELVVDLEHPLNFVGELVVLVDEVAAADGHGCRPSRRS